MPQLSNFIPFHHLSITSHQYQSKAFPFENFLFSNYYNSVLNSFKRTIKTRYYEININYQISSPFIIHQSPLTQQYQSKAFPFKTSSFSNYYNSVFNSLNEPLKRDTSFITHQSPLTHPSSISIKSISLREFFFFQLL